MTEALQNKSCSAFFSGFEAPYQRVHFVGQLGQVERIALGFTGQLRHPLRIAVDLAGEGLISREEAIGRVEPGALDALRNQLGQVAPRPAQAGTLAQQRVANFRAPAQLWIGRMPGMIGASIPAAAAASRKRPAK